ncbi:hypothetical protein ACFQRK_23025 [Parapedobacter sp. GCM10030251]|uniref:hypothetical protein n=1 Tax=Parapedobacter sp. GCM10030251 TaxID=3273419 RepID=UPI0036204699
MAGGRLHTDNPELLAYTEGRLHITVLGGIKLTGLDRLRVTLKLTVQGRGDKAYRHNLDLYNGIQCGQLAERASEALDMTESELSQWLNNLTAALEDYRTERLEAMKPKQAEKKVLTDAERKEALKFLKSPGLLQRTKEAIAQSGVIGEETNAMVAYLVYTSRKRHTPLHLMCLGASGTGKTWLQERVGELVPEEDRLEITTLSSNAFYYFGREELKHKLLLIEDLDGAESALYPLRELQSKRRISKTVTLKDNKGNLKTVTLNVEGPVCVSGCTTREKLYEDNANRCILLYMDGSAEQDNKIMDYQRKLSAGLVDETEQRKTKAKVKNVQRLLHPISVRNPYATYLKLPEAVFKPRRTMLLLLLFTETITWYHQYQRELKTDTETGEQYIESTPEDVQAAFTLLEDTLLKKSDELSDACRGFFEKLKAYLKKQGTDSFYSRDVRGPLRVNPSNLKRYLYELERMGHIRIAKGNRYKGFEYRVQEWGDMEDLQNGTRSLIGDVLDKIKALPVDRGPSVVHGANGPLNGQKTSGKGAVVHGR